MGMNSRYDIVEQAFRRIDVERREVIDDPDMGKETFEYVLTTKAPREKVARTKARSFLGLVHPSDLLNTTINNVERLGEGRKVRGKTVMNKYRLEVTVE